MLVIRSLKIERQNDIFYYNKNKGQLCLQQLAYSTVCHRIYLQSSNRYFNKTTTMYQELYIKQD